eukprot:scaffold538_cov413-Pavlova_lutheri.AAC.5
MQAQLDDLPARVFKVGDQVKVQYGLKGTTDKHKLDLYYVGTFTISEDLGNGAYRLQIPRNSPYSDRCNADRLSFWIDSDLTFLPTEGQIQTQPADLPSDPRVHPTITIPRYLLRDYKHFPYKLVRYWVQTDSAKTPYIWVDESSDLLDELLKLEENNGCIPEQGIHPGNKEAVKTHKQQVYLQYPTPILINTWTSNHLPLQTHNDQAYYQEIVTKVNPSSCTVQWTDEHKSRHPYVDVRTMLYDPISYAYEFLSS